jgi:hypothetical protein
MYSVAVLVDVTSRRSFPSPAVLCEVLPSFAPSSASATRTLAGWLTGWSAPLRRIIVAVVVKEPRMSPMSFSLAPNNRRQLKKSPETIEHLNWPGLLPQEGDPFVRFQGHYSLIPHPEEQ